MTAPQPPDGEDDAAMRRRLASLSRDLGGTAKTGGTQASGATPSPNGMGQAVSLGFRVMSEFVAAVAVGGFIGWALDRWLGTSPGGLILFIALGTAAGFWSVYRVATTTGSK